MGYFPLFVEMTDRPSLVIGGGPVAAGKVAGLLAAGARVTVVSPTLTPELERLAESGRIRHLRRAYDPGDLADQELVFVATGDSAVADRVCAEARRRRVWVNAADDPARCDAILPGRACVAVP